MAGVSSARGELFVEKKAGNFLLTSLTRNKARGTDRVKVGHEDFRTSQCRIYGPGDRQAQWRNFRLNLGLNSGVVAD